MNRLIREGKGLGSQTKEIPEYIQVAILTVGAIWIAISCFVGTIILIRRIYETVISGINFMLGV